MTANRMNDRNGSGEWFRSSDETGKALITGLQDGPEGFVFRKELEYSVVNGKAIFEGDIYLGEVDETGALLSPREVEERDAAEGDEPMPEAVVITGERFRWPAGIVPFEIDAALPNQQRVHDAIAHIEKLTNIRFVNRTAAHANYIQFFEGDGCWSSVGMQGGRQQISLAAGCGLGAAVHEILHALGDWHEQSREDRNSFVTIHFENIQAGREHNFNQHIVDGDDIGVYDYGSIMHYGRFAFSSNGLPTIEPLGGQVIGQRTGMSMLDIAAIRLLYPPVWPGAVYTIRQKSNSRFMDAHESSANDFKVVSRPAQNNDTQRWIVTPVGMVCTLIQKSSDRFMDAHETSANDFSVVTRPAQNNDSQLWVLLAAPGELCTYTLQQLSNGQYMDAHEISANDFSVVTRPEQNNNSQRWILTPQDSDTYRLQQKSNGRYLDAHETSANDFSVVTRPFQESDTQRWLVIPECGVYTIQQVSNGRYLDAHEISANDFAVVTRPAQNNNSQRWVIQPAVPGAYTVQQLSSVRFMDAHETSANDFSVVTRPGQNNDTQRWIFDRV